MDYDEIFDIMGNDVRRKILRCLAEGPRSIGELNELIDVSRQAILKHLKDLEQRGFIETREVEKQGKTPGPSPHLYELKQAFVIRFDLSPTGVTPKIITFQTGFPLVSEDELENGSKPQPKISLVEKLTELSTLNKQLEEITASYKEISTKKNALLHGLKIAIDRTISGEEERDVLELLINNPEKAIDGFTLQEIASELGIRVDFMKFILDNLLNAGILRLDPEGKYHLL